MTGKKDIPPTDTLYNVGQLNGLAARIQDDPWIKANCPEATDTVYKAAIILTREVGYPF